MSSYFLILPVEVQLMIVDYITRPTDLKAFCLVCKHFSTIATPLLYYTIDLRPRKIPLHSHASEISIVRREQLTRLKCLILGEKNFGYIRILMILECDWLMANALGSLLMPKFKDNCLIEFHYGNNGLYSAYNYHPQLAYSFPDSRQMEFIWSHQQKMQTFYSTHICTMLRFMRNNPERARAILQSVNQVTLVQKLEERESPELIIWPLENIATFSLRKLTIVGWDWAQNLRKVHNLFSNHAFTNLTHIRFEGVIFDTELELKQCPSLRELDIIRCGSLPTDAVKLSVPTKLPLKSFHFACDEDIDQLKLLAPILSQILGLFRLTLDLSSPNRIHKKMLNKCRREIVSALGMQQNTLVELLVREDATFMRPLVFGGKRLFAVIVECHTIRRLALPLGLKNPIPSYNRLMRRLPHLMYFWLTDWRKYVGNGMDEEFANELKEGIPASSKLRFLAFNNYCHTRLESSTQPGLDAEMAVSFMTEIDWKDANPLFYNQYPYPLVLPSKFTV